MSMLCQTSRLKVQVTNIDKLPSNKAFATNWNQTICCKRSGSCKNKTKVQTKRDEKTKLPKLTMRPNVDKQTSPCFVQATHRRPTLPTRPPL